MIWAFPSAGLLLWKKENTKSFLLLCSRYWYLTTCYPILKRETRQHRFPLQEGIWSHSATPRQSCSRGVGCFEKPICSKGSGERLLGKIKNNWIVNLLLRRGAISDADKNYWEGGCHNLIPAKNWPMKWQNKNICKFQHTPQPNIYSTSQISGRGAGLAAHAKNRILIEQGEEYTSTDRFQKESSVRY